MPLKIFWGNVLSQRSLFPSVSSKRKYQITFVWMFLIINVSASKMA